MSLQVGGLRQQPASVRHIAKCQNPHCGNEALTRLQDYVARNRCGWNTRMNAQDILDKWGPVKPVEVKSDAQEPVAVQEAPVRSGDTSTEAVEESGVGLPSAGDLDAAVSEQQVAEETGGNITDREPVPADAPAPRRGKNRR